MGVWIETKDGFIKIQKSEVTPCVGVWIETHKKHQLFFYLAVTPCVGVWIETESFLFTQTSLGHTLRGCVDWNMHDIFSKAVIPKSHPAWVCGLKLKKSAVLKIASPSHPAWVCGLKLYAGLPERFEIQLGHTLRGCVDWNGKPAEALYYFMGHTLRGCVDWNWKHTVRFSTILVTPCVGVWIETAMRKKYAKKQLSHPAWVCGLKRWNTWS